MDIITSHIGCDFDGLAAMVAASKLYPEAKLYLSGAPSREVREFLRLYRWMLPLETYRQSDLVHIKRLIIVDTRLMSRIGPFADLIGKQGVTVHLYDHHPPHPQDLKGDGGKSMEAGAATSILVSLLHERAIPINSFEATLFLLGIYEDTGSLRFSSTTPFDLRAVAYLLEKGAKLEYMAKFLDHGLTERQDQLLKTFLEGARTRTIQGLEVAIVSAEVEDFVGGLSGPLHRFIDLRSPDVVFAIVRSRAKTYLLGRSHVPFVNVDEIAAMFGGGGHPFAASALVAGVKVGSIEERLWKTLEERARPYLSAGYVAARPQRIIYAHETIKDAYKTLCREDRVVAPVEEDGDVIGLIARDKLKVIVEHNSPQDPVRSYVTRKLPRVSSGVSLREAHQVMVEQQTPWLLVFGKDQFQGVLTSLDIFRAYRSFPYYEDLALLLEKRIPARIINILRYAGKLAESLHSPGFIVGGFVRDLLLKNENLDIDLVVEGDGIVFAKKLAQEFGGQVCTHQDFGTATVNLEEGFKLDIATARKEHYPEPGKLPVVKPAPLREDLFRRDFTVNAMAMSINENDFGRLMDYFGGREDLEQSRVRVLHSDSFVDDPTRIFRAVRFEQRYAFTIDADTEMLIRDSLARGMLEKVSGKRIKEELVLILNEDHPERNIQRLQALNVFSAVHPGLSVSPLTTKLMDQLVDAIARYEVLAGAPLERWLIRLAILLFSVPEDEVQEFCSRCELTRKERTIILCCSAQELNSLIMRLRAPLMKASSIYYLLKSYPAEALVLAMARTRGHLTKRRIWQYFSQLSRVKTTITGKDLKSLGYYPSPEFSRIIELVHRARLDGEIQSRSEEIVFIRKHFAQGDST